MFEQWACSADYPTLYRVDRDVLVDVSRVFPGIGRRRQDELPLWVKASGLPFGAVDARTSNRMVAPPDGGWLAIVLMPASSGNGQSSITMQLWLEPELITTDLTTGT